MSKLVIYNVNITPVALLGKHTLFSVKQNSGTENFQTEYCRKEHLGTRKFQEYQFVMEFEKLFLEKIPGFYFEQGRKFQDF